MCIRIVVHFQDICRSHQTENTRLLVYMLVYLFVFSRVQISLRYILFNNLNSDQLKSGANETDLCINDAFSVI